jgi:fatty acid synthase
VYFDEAAQQIPHNAITIEIAPHGPLQAILKCSLNEGITNIALTQRGHPDNNEFLLTALGKYVSSFGYMEIKTLRTACNKTALLFLFGL